MRASRIEGGRRPSAAARTGLCLAAGVLALLAVSCQPSQPREPREPRDVDLPEYLRDTVGEIARFAGREWLPVQGYGFVTGLDGTGTRTVPPGVRQEILNMMRRNHVQDAETILASPGTAVVSVGGLLTPGIAAGERFDLEVRALPNTQTTSLEGGFLLACDLTRVATGRTGTVRTEPLAVGRGSIFVSPFLTEEDEEGERRQTVDPRFGRILAGGRALKTRHFRLVLLVPSVRTADQVVRLVNARFPGAAKGAEDPARIDLAVPRLYRDDKTQFLDLVGAIYLRESPAARDGRIAMLAKALAAGKDMDAVSLCLEGFGRSVVPQLRELADHPDAAVRFYAGRGLAHLQDAQAVHILSPIVKDDDSEFQEQAVRALGKIREGLGLGVLARAVDARSARVRVAAWRAIQGLMPDEFVKRVFRDQFVLSVVPTRGKPFVYVSRFDRQQLAVFGDVRVRPPVLSETRRVTATAVAGSERLALVSRRGGKDRRVDVPLDLASITEGMVLPVESEDGEEAGLGLGYSDVVGLVHELERAGALTGSVVLQPLEYHVPGDRPLQARPITLEPEDVE